MEVGCGTLTSTVEVVAVMSSPGGDEVAVNLAEVCRSLPPEVSTSATRESRVETTVQAFHGVSV